MFQYFQVLAALFPSRPCRYGDRRARVSGRPCDRDTMSDDAAAGQCECVRLKFTGLSVKNV